MSAARNFANVDAVRYAVAKSLGFGVRESAPYEEAEPGAEAEAEAASGDEAPAEAVEADEPAPPAPPEAATEAATEADRALQAIVERIEAEEGQGTDL